MTAGPLAALCAQPPDPAHGITPWPGVRFVVQLATLTSPNVARWDAAKWDTDRWGASYGWVDITGRGQHLSLTRGRISPGDRYRVAGGELVLDDDDGALDPWATSGPFAPGGSTIRPGALVRCGAVVAGTWCPWFTGGVERWAEQLTPSGTRQMVATISDTFTDLAALDQPARPDQGSGESSGARLDRLLTDAAWRFGQTLDAGTITCQSTAMAGPRLAECYLVTDSDGGLFYAQGDGSARFLQMLAHPTVYAGGYCDYPHTGFLPYVAITPACDDSRILNVANVAPVGGSVATATDATSMVTYGARSSGMGFPRLDLIYAGPADHNQTLANNAVARFANDVLRVDSITLDADTDPALPAAMSRLDLGVLVDVSRTVGGAQQVTRYRVGSLGYAVTPAGRVPLFTLTVGLEAP